MAAGARVGRRAGTAGTAPALGIFGHREAREQVLSAMAQGRLGPVLLVTGPLGVGKEAFGFWVARALLCAGPEPRPCESCASCVRIVALQHPDVHWFFPVPAESAFGEGELAKLLERIRAEPRNPAHRRFPQPASFRMHQAALIYKLAAAKSFEGGQRVFLLGDYEQNPSDQVHNALLKVLEEPPPRATFVLTTSRAQGLPATILSRCRQIRLGPLLPEEMEAFLAAVGRLEGRDVSGEGGRELLARAEGRPGKLLERLYEGDHTAEEAEELLRRVVEGGPLASYSYALTTGFRGSREDHNRRLDALSLLWRDLLRVRAGAADSLARRDLLDLYAGAAPGLDPSLGAAAALEVERAREQVRANAYAPLVFWRLFRTLALALDSATGAAPASHRGSA